MSINGIGRDILEVRFRTGSIRRNITRYFVKYWRCSRTRYVRVFRGGPLIANHFYTYTFGLPIGNIHLDYKVDLSYADENSVTLGHYSEQTDECRKIRSENIFVIYYSVAVNQMEYRQ